MAAPEEVTVSGGRVIVVGSVNVDLVVSVPRLPGPGETVTGGDVARHHGGKGGNQAVAAARLGAAVAFVGAVGRDDFGAAARSALAAEGIDVDHLAAVERPTGVALIVVDEDAENLIAVAPGANHALTPGFVDDALHALQIGPGDVMLVCREIPPDAVSSALTTGRAGAIGLLNPAPADGLDEATIALADVITPNESELRLITGSAEAEAGARSLLGGEARDRAVVVTRGGAGVVIVRAAEPAISVPAVTVKPVDTTGAGDAFNGALAAGLASGLSLVDAARRAVRAAGISTTRRGARDGMPRAAELEAFASPP
jgi:ribokinase